MRGELWVWGQLGLVASSRPAWDQVPDLVSKKKKKKILNTTEQTNKKQKGKNQKGKSVKPKYETWIESIKSKSFCQIDWILCLKGKKEGPSL
jgi:hypothetical protein